jgi:hypothetical protein
VPSEDNELPDVQFATREDLERAWAAWVWLERVEWRCLPLSGGLLDQPAALMRDILKVARVAQWVRKSFKQPQLR